MKKTLFTVSYLSLILSLSSPLFACEDDSQPFQLSYSSHSVSASQTEEENFDLGVLRKSIAGLFHQCDLSRNPHNFQKILQKLVPLPYETLIQCLEDLEVLFLPLESFDSHSCLHEDRQTLLAELPLEKSREIGKIVRPYVLKYVFSSVEKDLPSRLNLFKFLSEGTSLGEKERYLEILGSFITADSTFCSFVEIVTKYKKEMSLFVRESDASKKRIKDTIRKFACMSEEVLLKEKGRCLEILENPMYKGEGGLTVQGRDEKGNEFEKTRRQYERMSVDRSDLEKCEDRIKLFKFLSKKHTDIDSFFNSLITLIPDILFHDFVEIFGKYNEDVIFMEKARAFKRICDIPFKQENLHMYYEDFNSEFFRETGEAFQRICNDIPFTQENLDIFYKVAEVPGMVSNPELDPSSENKFRKLFLKKPNVSRDFKGFSPGTADKVLENPFFEGNDEFSKSCIENYIFLRELEKYHKKKKSALLREVFVRPTPINFPLFAREERVVVPLAVSLFTQSMPRNTKLQIVWSVLEIPFPIRDGIVDFLSQNLASIQPFEYRIFKHPNFVKKSYIVRSWDAKDLMNFIELNRSLEKENFDIDVLRKGIAGLFHQCDLSRNRDNFQKILQKFAPLPYETLIQCFEDLEVLFLPLESFDSHSCLHKDRQTLLAELPLEKLREIGKIVRPYVSKYVFSSVEKDLPSRLSLFKFLSEGDSLGEKERYLEILGSFITADLTFCNFVEIATKYMEEMPLFVKESDATKTIKETIHQYERMWKDFFLEEQKRCLEILERPTYTREQGPSVQGSDEKRNEFEKTRRQYERMSVDPSDLEKCEGRIKLFKFLSKKSTDIDSFFKSLITLIPSILFHDFVEIFEKYNEDVSFMEKAKAFKRICDIPFKQENLHMYYEDFNSEIFRETGQAFQRTCNDIPFTQENLDIFYKVLENPFFEGNDEFSKSCIENYIFLRELEKYHKKKKSALLREVFVRPTPINFPLFAREERVVVPLAVSLFTQSMPRNTKLQIIWSVLEMPLPIRDGIVEFLSQNLASVQPFEYRTFKHPNPVEKSIVRSWDAKNLMNFI